MKTIGWVCGGSINGVSDGLASLAKIRSDVHGTVGVVYTLSAIPLKHGIQKDL